MVNDEDAFFGLATRGDDSAIYKSSGSSSNGLLRDLGFLVLKDPANSDSSSEWFPRKFVWSGVAITLMLAGPWPKCFRLDRGITRRRFFLQPTNVLDP